MLLSTLIRSSSADCAQGITLVAADNIEVLTIGAPPGYVGTESMFQGTTGYGMTSENTKRYVIADDLVPNWKWANLFHPAQAQVITFRCGRTCVAEYSTRGYNYLMGRTALPSVG